MAKRRSRKTETLRKQHQIVVRVDIIIYILIAVIAVLALASACWPGRVDLAVLSGLGALMASTLTGWLTFMRLSQTDNEDEGDGKKE